MIAHIIDGEVLVPRRRPRDTRVCMRYLVDPASIICLSLRSKPCMSKYKFDCTVKLRTAHYISYSFFDGPASPVVIAPAKVAVGVSWITVGILELIHEQQRRPEARALGRAGFVPVSAARATVPRVSADKVADRSDLTVGDGSFKFLPYQLSMVAYWATMAVTGDGESGFGSGEGA